MPVRQIVKIDEELCDGCGQCVLACAEGAIQIVDGKAKLVADKLCDGLAACLGDCPRGAITMEERKAEDFDQGAVRKHLQELGQAEREEELAKQAHPHHGHSCPSARIMDLMDNSPEETKNTTGGGQTPHDMPSYLTNWPVKLELIPPNAPFLEGEDLLLAADCSAYALPAFQQLMRGKTTMIACPKFGDYPLFEDKITAIIKEMKPKSITVARMEVPCCGGLYYMIENALQRSGVSLPVKEIVVGIQGEIIAEKELVWGADGVER